MALLSFPHGGLPKVVGTLTSPRWDLLRKPAQAPCEVVEVRLDEIGSSEEGHWLERCREIEAAGLPVILTIRHFSEGGKWKGSEAERLRLYQRALREVSAVDVEWRSEIAPELSRAAKSLGRLIILSYHDFEATPPVKDLEGIVAKARESAGVVKVTTMVHTPSHLARLRKLLAGRRKTPLCVMGMGSLGASARVEFAVAGSCLIYGWLDRPAAPGQLSAAELDAGLRKALPKYARHRAAARREKRA